MYQKLTIVGRLGRDPEMNYTPEGTPVTKFSIASSEKWTGKDGAKHEATTWVTVSVWGNKAEPCAQYLHKGDLALVEGRLSPGDNGGPRIWTGKDGEAHASFEMKADSVVFLNTKGGDRESNESRRGGVDYGDTLPF